MLLSIVIPTLNEEKYLPRLLESIKKQSFADYEIIVCDGGSSDKTREIASKACRVLEYIEHRHPSWQRNKGAEMAKGDLIMFLDADTCLQAGFLNKSLAEFNGRGLAVASFYMEFNPNKTLYKIYARIFNFFCYLRQYFAPAGVGSAILVRREVHQKIKGFDVDLYVAEDFDYCYRASRLGRFRMINSLPVLASSRRLEKEGGIKVGLKWMVMSFYTLFNRPIKRKVVKYEFGKY